MMEANELYQPFFIKTKIPQNNRDPREIITEYLTNEVRIAFCLPEHLKIFHPTLLVDFACLLTDYVAYRNETENMFANFLNQPAEDVDDNEFNQALVDYAFVVGDRDNSIQLKGEIPSTYKEHHKLFIITHIENLSILVKSSFLFFNRKKLNALNVVQLVNMAILLTQAHDKIKEVEQLYSNFVENQLPKEKKSVRVEPLIMSDDNIGMLRDRIAKTLEQLDSIEKDETGRCK